MDDSSAMTLLYTPEAVRNEETIDSGKAVEGQGYAAEIASDVLDAR